MKSDTDDDPIYVLQDSRSYIGNDVLFWARDRKGYTTDLDQAHKFTKDEAERQHRERKTDTPRRFDEMERLARRVVDTQGLSR